MKKIKSLKDIEYGDLLLIDGRGFKETIFEAIDLVYNGSTYILNLVNDECGMFFHEDTFLLEFEPSISKFYLLIKYDSESSYILKNIKVFEKKDIYNLNYLHRISGYKI